METRHFDVELHTLKDDVLLMASKVEHLITLAMSALSLRNKIMAESILDLDKDINARELAVEDSAIRLIALHQPTASDLRLLVGIIHINETLERIGDHGVNIAQCTLELLDEPPLTPLADISRMTVEATTMFRESIASFVSGDSERAHDVCCRDYLVDNLKNKLFETLQHLMMEDRSTISRAMQLVLVSRNLERIADLATNIAEETIYIYRGAVIKHGHYSDFRA